jgi:hypothetical protein
MPRSGAHAPPHFIRLLLDFSQSRAEAGQRRGNQVTDKENLAKPLRSIDVVRCPDKRGIMAPASMAAIRLAAAEGDNLDVLIGY